MIKQKKIIPKSQITKVKHTVDWFINRIGQSIFYRIQRSPDSWERVYIKVQSDSHAKSLYIHQNVSGKRYFL